MNRKSIIIVSAVILVAAFSASAFAQKGGGSGRSKGKGKSHSGYKQHGGQHHFKSKLGGGQHHSSGGKSGKSFSHQHSFKTKKHTGHHFGHVNKFYSRNNYGHSFHSHGLHSRGKHQRKNYINQFHLKYVNAQHHFAVRSNLYLIQFHQFPYDVCWHNGKYWVCFNGTWMPYTYLINNHAGAWNWHQKHYQLHDHAAFKKNWKKGNVPLVYGAKSKN